MTAQPSAAEWAAASRRTLRVVALLRQQDGAIPQQVRRRVSVLERLHTALLDRYEAARRNETLSKRGT